ARPDVERAQAEYQGIGAVRDRDRVLDAEVLRELVLERRHLRPEDEASACAGRADALEPLPLERSELGGEIEERNGLYLGVHLVILSLTSSATRSASSPARPS